MKTFVLKIFNLLALTLSIVGLGSGAHAEGSDDVHASNRIMWINHLDLMPGDPSVTTSFNAIQSGGIVIHSSTLGDTAPGGGNKGVEMTLQVPPKYHVKGVRICYRNSSPGTFITQVRLAQLQNPPTSWLVKLDDGTDLNAAGAVCIDSQPTSINPQQGSIRFNLRTNFANVADTITVLATGLWLQRQ